MGPGPDPGWLVAAVGVGLTVVGWYQISGQPTEAQQLPYLASATIPGAALIVAGTMMVAARRIADAARRGTERAEHPYDSVRYAPERRQADAGASAGLWALPEGNYVHRADCPLIDGKPEAFEVSREKTAAGEAPFRPCPICAPELEPNTSSDSVRSTRKGAELPQKGPEPTPDDSVRSASGNADTENQRVEQGPSDTVRSSDEGAEQEEAPSGTGPDDSVRSAGGAGGAAGLGDVGAESEAGSSDSAGSGGADSAERG